jgi:hypothetical protein
MARPDLIVFGGPKSQTGQATATEFPGAIIPVNSDSFDVLYGKVESKECSLTLPVWNSNGGEIKESKVFDMLFQQKAVLFRIWPGRINWQVITRSKVQELLEVVGVKACEAQCSNIIGSNGWAFVSMRSSMTAYDSFHGGQGNIAIIAPNQNEHGYPVLVPDAANPLNFTTFVLIGCRSSVSWSLEDWAALRPGREPGSDQVHYFGIEVPLSTTTVVVGEEIQAVLDEMSVDIAHVDDLAKLLFVARRSDDTLGFIMESKDDGVPEVLTDEGRSNRIRVVPGLGLGNQRYLPRVEQVLGELQADYSGADFFMHQGSNSCFFACPALGLLTHGYETDAVEKTFRVILAHYFALIENDAVDATVIQRELFNRHAARYRQSQLNAFRFHAVARR